MEPQEASPGVCEICHQQTDLRRHLAYHEDQGAAESQLAALTVEELGEGPLGGRRGLGEGLENERKLLAAVRQLTCEDGKIQLVVGP